MQGELCPICGLEEKASSASICNTCRNRRNRAKRSKIRKRVYFVRSDNGLIKIGCSIDPHRRFYDLKSSSPITLETIGSIEGDRLVEKMLHDRFRSYNHHGEWFYFTPELQLQIASIIEDDKPLKQEYESYKRQLVEALRP